jgi:diguanylate cyclase (GGDEF)-like protein/hemerythrin-like metal-binding protein
VSERLFQTIFQAITMDAFQWNSCFITGLIDVDEQHQQLVDLINRFGTLIMRQEETSTSELEVVFAELADYARYHFADEEALMVSMHLDPRYVTQHRANHASFFDEVTQLHEGISASNRDAAKLLLQFLTHWLAYHILGTDQFMAKQIAAIQSGSRPEEAFLDHATTKDPATDALLTALNELFHQVSERNHALVQLNKTLEARVEERTRALTDANERLDDLANTDTLTGLPNRRHAMRSFATEWETAVREGKALACMMIDADGFKVVNDTHGHDAGDTVLRALSKQLLHAVRNDDMVCRLGGDEFLIICAGTPLDSAIKLAEVVREEIAALRVAAGPGEWIGSISVGVAARTADMAGIEELMKAADLGVYLAKGNGRNCVATAQNRVLSTLTE